MVQKCFIDQEFLQEHHAFAIKAYFHGKNKEGTIMCLPKSMHALQKEEECMKILSLIGLDQLFHLPPCDIDVRRCHELLNTLQEDGTCMLSDQAGELVELNITQDIIVKALRLQEQNNVISSMKLTSIDKLLAFTVNNANNSVYASLKDDEIWLTL